MKLYQPVNCDLHDYLEIACLYQYKLLIELTDGSCFDGKALTTHTTIEREEFLEIEGRETHRKIRLDFLSAITPLSTRAIFGKIIFARPDDIDLL
ncbi:Rho-binding antiterminator [Lelliottia sp. JS-SCA-14]|uniref:Rho-binding antiterminator n=1 Tax=Lelliottia sp. JS-SCA-14 TaxID=3110110 RepID=UPI002D79F513|nr:Rho-binding antiterminator [Lelliottia sp. JS-SCA-14]